MDTEDMRFFVKRDDGEEIECVVLFSFDNEETGKSYVVYTDCSVNEEGKTNIYASIYNPLKGRQKLIPIENQEEWKVIEEVIEQVKAEYLSEQ